MLQYICMLKLVKMMSSVTKHMLLHSLISLTFLCAYFETMTPFSVTLREGYRLEVFEKSVLRRKFGPNRDKLQ
jgi:hypothetical protein